MFILSFEKPVYIKQIVLCGTGDLLPNLSFHMCDLKAQTDNIYFSIGNDNSNRLLLKVCNKSTASLIDTTEHVVWLKEGKRIRTPQDGSLLNP